ncbi:hypothetical protein [Cellulomonas aerilata]|uniref:Uncharacterized protein n=1 Tax=Cellulomonas aerilata TaxID=515326 RepID=A0A512D8Q3_9CELL|nr:hypothetical protein [Cellulomonas aerilata]GEO32650.1 hypothetical protein CAE01nite_03750 [Cellulomonas aerilata]
MTATRTGSAITAMWAWDNPVDPADDPRGRGYAPAAADRLAAFARAGQLREVHLLAPSGPAGGVVDAWAAEAVAALHAEGVRVTAVSGVSGATPRWTEAVLALAPFDRLQVVVLPWAAPAPGRSVADLGTALAAALTAVRGAGGGLPVDASVPWWFATGDGATGGALEALVPLADRVALAAPAPRAHGEGGILELAAPAVATLGAAGRPFMVAVQTDAPDIAGGADRTFFDEGPVALIRECALVGQALGEVPGFEGVAVKAHRAWRRLLGV